MRAAPGKLSFVSRTAVVVLVKVGVTVKGRSPGQGRGQSGRMKTLRNSENSLSLFVMNSGELAGGAAVGDGKGTIADQART